MGWNYNWTNQYDALTWNEQYENAEEIWDLFIRDERSELLENVLKLMIENVELSKSINLSAFLQKIISMSDVRADRPSKRCLLRLGSRGTDNPAPLR